MLLNESGLVGDYRHAGFDSLEMSKPLIEPVNVCKAYADSFPKCGWLVLAGEYGCGKTLMASCIATTLIQDCVAVQMFNVTEYFEKLKKTFGNSDMPKPEPPKLDARLLILDEVAKEPEPYASWQRTELYSWINHRDIRNLPTIITTNRKTNKELVKACGGATVDRILAHSLWVKIDAPSYRLKLHNKRNKEG
jgi:DNA replication protein DnaC